MPQDGLKTSEELQLEKEPIRVRETGLWFWRRVIVPPNAYVVHTRMGRQAPVTLGLGLSFRYDPYKDFTGVAYIGTAPLVLVAGPALTVNTVPELIALAKAKPGSFD